ncbi:thiosulfate/3-mercaptopyruvate sulfurtransferase [Actinoplanes tereljensis]|uniref:Sulfurtransferase n=1 Tax=Paractinoplanes tereljensis TaxID=571912 RepID=A0A919TXP4_9ACTN|nr:rhodanese-like domain-containing protein [Actinoplanes tereljensis]GIF26541.1 sulfurtransferase [Actinoplanes tereljensis]
MTAPLVDAAWLHEHLAEVVVLDASIERTAEGFKPGFAAYAEAHIPGARFADLFTAFSDPDAPYPFTMPPVEQLRAAAQAVGVCDGARVVVYDRNGGAWAARVWWLLRVHGFESVSVLDGGLGAWTFPVESSTLTLGAPGPVTADLADVTAGQDQLVCALRRPSFEDEHIPGSTNLPYPELLRLDGTLDLDLIRERAAAIGLSASAIVYCGGGINAAGLVLALEAAGLPAPRLYDGSLSEWRERGRE